MENAREEIRRFITLTLATGQRGGDVVAMSLHNIENGEVRVLQKKTGKELWIPLPENAMQIVDQTRAAGFTFLITENGRRYTPSQFRGMWDREMEKSVFAPILEAELVPHGLIKNAHNTLFEAGNNEAEVQAVTGRSADMVRHYSKARDQRVMARRAINRRDRPVEKVLQSTAKA